MSRPNTGRHGYAPVDNPYAGGGQPHADAGFYPQPSAPPLPAGQGQYPPAQPPPPGYPAPQRPMAPIVNDKPWLRYGVTQDEYDYMTSLFVNFDDNDTGGLDRRELARLARWLNYPSTPQDVDRMFREMDKDGSGNLDLHEFLTYYMDKKPDPSCMYGLSHREYNEVLMQFREYDTNHDGYLSRPEFAYLAKRHGIAITDYDADCIFSEIDKNQNGVVDLNEFLLYMKPFR